MTAKGLFISFEGIDGAGKSTHIAALVDRCRAQGRTVTQTREPGGTPLAESLRELVLQTTGEVHHELQETLCDALLNQLLLHPSIVAVRVQTRKPDVYADCSSVGTERIGHKPW